MFSRMQTHLCISKVLVRSIWQVTKTYEFHRKLKIEQVVKANYDDILTLRLLANAACRWLMALIQRACYKD
jgi:hypothetical protein